jgi:hypothetical protein
MLYVHISAVNLLQHYLFGTSHLAWFLNSLVCIAIVRWIIWPVILAPILDFADFRTQKKLKMLTIELTPPSSSNRTSFANEELFRIIHNLYTAQSINDQFLRRRRIISFEIVSTKAQGIRFQIKIPRSTVSAFEKLIASYLPELKFKQIKDNVNALKYLSTDSVELRQAASFMYPLRQNSRLADHDPIRYLTGALSKPGPHDVFKFQLLLSPYDASRSAKLRNRIINNDSSVTPVTSKHAIIHFILACTNVFYQFILMTYNGAALLVNVLSGNFRFKNGSPQALAQHADTSNEVKVSIIKKLSEPLFYGDIRIFVASSNSGVASEHLQTIVSSLGSLDEAGYQKLVPKVKLVKGNHFKDQLGMTHTSVLRRSSSVLSVSEVAAMYHFPYGRTAASEGVAQSMSKSLPAPNAMKKNNQTRAFDVVLGRNVYHGATMNIGLTAEERKRHTYIIGGTGNGKTTLLEYAIEQDIRRGKGVAVIDPHGDLSQKILNYIPKERIKDVIYFNPSDLDFPIAMNLLELPRNLSETELLNEKDFVTEAIVSMFRKIFSDDDSGGHRIEYILRNAIHTAMTVEGATLFTILKLLRNSAYRKSITSKIDDEDLRDFWREEIGKAGDFQRVKMSAGITSKIDRFRRSASVKGIIDHKESTINFDEIIDGKILICNLAKGLIGEDTSELLGISILTKLQLAAYRRIRRKQSERVPFFLYVDEFQNFATTQFLQMLSEARKYGLVLTMAEQSTSQQQDQKMVEVILNNVGTLICFRTGSSRDEQMLLPQFKPYVEEGEIGNLPAYNFYMRLRAIEAYEPMSGMTILLNTKKDAKQINKVIAYSRKRYAVRPQVVEETVMSGEEAPVTKIEVPSLVISKKNIELAN